LKINKNLNLVVQIQTADYGTVHIHSTAVSREIFEQFYLELGKVFSQCFESDNPSHVALSAPRLAYPALKSISTQSNTWDGPSGVKFGLINEIIRLTNVIFCGEKGWETVPLEVATKRGIIDEDEEAEVMSSLVFFTAISKVAPRDFRISFLEMAGNLRHWVVTSLDCMAYQTGLPTLTKTDVTGKKVTESSLIS